VSQLVPDDVQRARERVERDAVPVAVEHEPVRDVRRVVDEETDHLRGEQAGSLSGQRVRDAHDLDIPVVETPPAEALVVVIVDPPLVRMGVHDGAIGPRSACAARDVRVEDHPRLEEVVQPGRAAEEAEGERRGRPQQIDRLIPV
jgi:hypothetical protein